ncbi:MAG: menaquinol-cytochrome c reductase cytochrome b/c subunit [Bacilli bacterium]|nr:menaquinol-cytochrome c reductase cytochrome b/c subunit [Bacilli bacterium]
MAHGHDSDEKVVYVGDSRVRQKSQRPIPADFSSYPGKSEVFIPNFLLKEWMVAVVCMVGILALVISDPPPLGFPANPTNTAFIPMPDWYFLFMYQLLKYPYTSGSYVVFGTVILPGLLFGGLIIAPFLDTGKERRFYRRPIASSMMFLTLIAVVYLTVFSWHHYKQELALTGKPSEDIQHEEELQAAKKSGQPAPGSGSANAAVIPIVASDDPGALIFQKATCIGCHGVDLKGNKNIGVPALLGVGDKYDAAGILDIIKNGKGNGKMAPQYDANKSTKGLTDDDINKLAGWLAKQKKA